MCDKSDDSRLDALPPEIWRGLEFTSIKAVILFADLENSVLLSSIQHPDEYQRLINAFQQAMLNLVKQLQGQGMSIGEYSIAGDQLSIFFYDSTDVNRNYRLNGPDPVQGEERSRIEEEASKQGSILAFAALKSAIQLKNVWLAHELNVMRVKDQLDPFGLGIGLHIGNVTLCERPDGKKRIEGFAVNKAKRIESSARHGKFSRIMLSRQCHDAIRGYRLKHTMLRQRIFFHQHNLDFELLKGLTRSQPVFELKFYSRLSMRWSKEIIKQYDELFALDPSYIWAYYQLFEYYAYGEEDWGKVAELARQAQLVYPHDEKVLLDLSRYYFNMGSFEQAQQLAMQALEQNKDFDLVYEHLAVMAFYRDDVTAQFDFLSKAMGLAPGSPVNHFNFGMILCQVGKPEEGTFHIKEAIRLFPGYLRNGEILKAFSDAKAKGILPTELLEYLASSGCNLDDVS